jgi:2Fe-2S iron-sulfur cluster binding domain
VGDPRIVAARSARELPQGSRCPGGPSGPPSPPCPSAASGAPSGSWIRHRTEHARKTNTPSGVGHLVAARKRSHSSLGGTHQCRVFLGLMGPDVRSLSHATPNKCGIPGDQSTSDGGNSVGTELQRTERTPRPRAWSQPPVLSCSNRDGRCCRRCRPRDLMGQSPSADPLDVDDRRGTVPVTLRVNGKEHRLRIDPRTTLLDCLRESIALTGTKKGCDHGQCGACTLHVNGRSVNSCLSLMP